MRERRARAWTVVAATAALAPLYSAFEAIHTPSADDLRDALHYSMPPLACSCGLAAARAAPPNRRAKIHLLVISPLRAWFPGSINAPPWCIDDIINLGEHGRPDHGGALSVS